MHRLAILAACIAFPLMAQTVTIQPKDSKPATMTKSFALKDGGKVKVENVNGDIKVSGWDKNEVGLVARFKPSSENKHLMLEVKNSADSFEIVAKDDKKWSLFGPKKNAVCDMELNVPRNITGYIENVNGRISVSETKKEINVENVNGAVTISDTAGKLKAENVNGAITLKNVAGHIKASTVNGSIGGSISTVDELLDLGTVNGSIKIELQNPNGNLEASTTNGSTLLNAPGARDIEAKKTSLKARFGIGNAILKLETVNGSIVVN